MLITLPKRRPKRVRVLLHSQLESATGQHPARIRDVSSEGLLVEMTEPPVVGETVTVCYQTHRLVGAVIWQEGSWIGVKLEKALAPKLWNTLTAKALRVGAPRKYRHDALEEDEAQVEVTPRRIRLKRI